MILVTDCGMVPVARLAGLSVSETDCLLGFSHYFVMTGVKGECPD